MPEMTTDWWVAALGGGDPLALYAYCDWLEEQGGGEDAVAFRLLPCLWVAIQVFREPRHTDCDLIPGPMEGVVRIHLWDRWGYQWDGNTDLSHPAVNALAAAASGDADHPAVRWFLAHTGCQLAWTGSGVVRLLFPEPAPLANAKGG